MTKKTGQKVDKPGHRRCGVCGRKTMGGSRRDPLCAFCLKRITRDVWTLNFTRAAMRALSNIARRSA
jgi:hypothetical protein